MRHSPADVLQRLNMSYWMNFVGQYFTDKSTIKLTLWKDNQQVEAKPFGARIFESQPAVYDVLTSYFRNRLSYFPAVLPCHKSIRSQIPTSRP